MVKSRRAMQTWTVFVLLGALAGVSGGRCSTIVLPPPIVVNTAASVELINNTNFLVDPGLFENGAEIVIDPPLAAGEIHPPFDVDCSAGAFLEVDARLFAPEGVIPSANVPRLEERFEYFCGDLISIFFEDDGIDFFTCVEVNGVDITGCR